MTSANTTTNTRADLVHLLLKQIETSVASSSHISIQGVTSTGFSAQIGSDPKAVVTVSICDPKIPSFAATYPGLKLTRSEETIEECTSTDMLAEGVVWIVRKVFRFGFVPPEGYRKNQKNRGRPIQQRAADNDGALPRRV